MIRLVATDMDGTLLNSRKELPPDFESWVVHHPEIRVVIASGRQYQTLYDNFSAAREQLIYIADNGALVFERGQVLYENVMEPGDVLACLDMAEGRPGMYPILCGAESAWMVHATEQAEFEAKRYYHRLAFPETLRSVVDGNRDRIVKIALYLDGSGAPVEAEAARLRSLEPRLHPVVSGPDWIDVANASVSKGAALRSIQKRYNIPPECCMSFGDYMNDYTLLRSCGESYAMANAAPDLRTAAKHQTASNDEDGVMRVLRTLEHGRGL